MNYGSFFQRILNALPLVPVIVAGVERTNQDMPGSTKKQLAMSYLGLAAGTADVIAPEHQQTTDAVANIVSQLIDQIVAGAKKTGEFTSSTKSFIQSTPPPVTSASAGLGSMGEDIEFHPEPPATPSYMKK